jgi:hypothetical protein
VSGERDEGRVELTVLSGARVRVRSELLSVDCYLLIRPFKPAAVRVHRHPRAVHLPVYKLAIIFATCECRVCECRVIFATLSGVGVSGERDEGSVELMDEGVEWSKSEE